MSNIIELIQKQKPAIKAALPSHVKADRIVRIAQTMVKKNPRLGECHPHTVLGSIMLASQLGLEPNTPLGQCYIIPYKKDAQFQLGYKGLIDLCYRTNKYKTIYAMPVYDEDEFDYQYGLNPDLTHIPGVRKDTSEPIAYYAVYKLENGGQDFRVLTRKDAEKHGRKFSKTFAKGPWQTDFDSMAMKTVIKQVLKYAPTTVELAQLDGLDDGVVSFDKDEGIIDGDVVDVEAVDTENQSPDALIDALEEE